MYCTWFSIQIDFTWYPVRYTVYFNASNLDHHFVLNYDYATTTTTTTTTTKVWHYSETTLIHFQMKQDDNDNSNGNSNDNDNNDDVEDVRRCVEDLKMH